MTTLPSSPDGYADLNDESEEGEVRIKESDLFLDLGQTGLKRAGGVLDEEFLPALRGQRAVKVFNEMSLNNSTVHSLVFAITNLLAQTKWVVTIKDRSGDGEKAVQFLESVMDDMSSPWSEVISEILTCIIYGWSYHEIVYKRRIGPWEENARNRSKFTDGLIGWRKLPIRAQETLLRWRFDENGGIKGMTQMAAPRYEQLFIPIEKALLFRVGTHKNSPEGRSLLRGAYRSWYWLKRFEELEAISVERDMAGMPVARVPSQLMMSKNPQDQKMLKAIKALVKNIRRDEHNGIIFPSDVDRETKAKLYEFELMSSTGSHTMDTGAIIQRLETNILESVLADFIKLGATSAGSYAMHVDKTGIFRQALNSVLGSIADVFNRHAVPRLFKANGWRPKNLPEFKPEPVENPNLGELAGFMTAMASLGEEFFPDPSLSKYVRDIAGLPEMSEEKEESLQTQEEQKIQDSYVEAATESSAKDAELQGAEMEAETTEADRIKEQTGENVTPGQEQREMQEQEDKELGHEEQMEQARQGGDPGGQPQGGGQPPLQDRLGQLMRQRRQQMQR